jgi:hypothetical protein
MVVPMVRALATTITSGAWMPRLEERLVSHSSRSSGIHRVRLIGAEKKGEKLKRRAGGGSFTLPPPFCDSVF